jgi:hypothetical protein
MSGAAVKGPLRLPNCSDEIGEVRWQSSEDCSFAATGLAGGPDPLGEGGGRRVSSDSVTKAKVCKPARKGKQGKDPAVGTMYSDKPTLAAEEVLAYLYCMSFREISGG